MKSITVAEYLLQRLKEFNVECIFGVPGDYNLGLLDYVVHSKDHKWIGNCNELNASYAADGYARIKGMAALITTFGVGELSAINGIAGAYAEHVPIVNIVSIPSLVAQSKKLFLHHNISPDSYENFIDMFKSVTIGQTVLTPENAGAEIDRLLTLAWEKKLPVYIGIPSDVTSYQIKAPSKPLDLSRSLVTDKAALKEATEAIVKMIKEAKDPIILLDGYAERHGYLKEAKSLLEKLDLPFAVTAMGKGLVDETKPNFLGLYYGDFGNKEVIKRIENSDCVIEFGLNFQDFNTGDFTIDIHMNNSINIEKETVRVKHSHFKNIHVLDLLPALEKALNDYIPKKIRNKNPTPQTEPYKASERKLTLFRFWERMDTFFKNNDVIIAETGTSAYGLLEVKLPENVFVMSQFLWASIGFTLPALLGASLAAQKGRQILFIGDGSFQLTAQELSTMIRCKLSPIIFLINNDGYVIERVIHGEKEIYNEIQPWSYHKLPEIFGKNVWSTKVNTEVELEEALQKIPEHNDKLVFIEVVTGRMETPKILEDLAKTTAKLNEY